jgi:hypothetical protein
MMKCLRIVAGFGSFFAAFLFSGSARAADISGTIATTLTITQDSRLIDDVTCKVTGAPCIAFGAPGLTLDLNGYSITGLADVATTCSGGPTTLAPPAVEDGIDFNAQPNGTVRGPGVIQLFRGPGIFSLNTSGVTVTGVTTANNCMSGILVGGGSGHTISDNIAIRNGNRTQPCGGI